MSFIRYFVPALLVLAFAISQTGCNHITYSTVPRAANDTIGEGPDPDFSRSLDFDFQDFTSYLFMGNRVENFTAYFNKFFQAEGDFSDALEEYRAGLISTYNRRLDSLGITPPVSATVKEKLDKAIERASKIIQFHKNSKYIDDAVLLIGEAYYFQTDYINAERKFNEFLQRLSSSELTDEALLYLARTKLRLGKNEDGLRILGDLVKNSDDREIRSLAARDLGVYDYNNGRLKESVENFKKAIEYSDDNVRKAENQFILARLSSVYKPESAADEFKKVLDYSPDFDLTFFARLNYAKGLIVNKKYSDAEDELTSMRKKYRDFKDFTPLIDLEIANNLYAEGDIIQAKQKYYEVIVKYANTTSAADAYCFLGKDLETKQKDYMNALVNYKKATQENTLSEFYPESSRKAKTLEKYFNLLADIKGDKELRIPETNPEVEAYRALYNEEKGIEDLNKQNNQNQQNTGDGTEDGTQEGRGKGNPGGFSNAGAVHPADSVEDVTKNPNSNANPDPTGAFNPGNVSQEKGEEIQKEAKENEKVQDSLGAIKEAGDELEKANKIYNSYYELAELFMYDMNMPDSAEHYLKLLLDMYPDADKKPKTLFMLGTFYKSLGKEQLSAEAFEQIIAAYPATVYAKESRSLLRKSAGTDSLNADSDGDLLTRALIKFNSESYPEAISLMKEYIDKNPTDTLSAKALLGIGWIYQNKLLNKDSAIAYYNLLKLRFPGSEYYASIAPTLDFLLSLEPKTSTDSLGVNQSLPDSLAANQNVTGNTESGETGIVVAPKEAGTKLSIEELEYLLMKGESP